MADRLALLQAKDGRSANLFRREESAKSQTFDGVSHGLRNEVALGVNRLLDHFRSPHARKAVMDRGFPASQRDSLLNAHDERRTAPIDLRLASAFLDSR